MDLAEAIGVGAIFCRGGKPPSYGDQGLVERLAKNPLPSGGLFIVGPVGTHKTHLLAARCVDAARRGWTARIVKWARFLLEAKGGNAARGFNAELCLVDQLASLDYLAVDDLCFGRADQPETEANLRLAYELFDARYEAKKTTDITTNLLPEDVEARFDARIGRRICEMCTVYPMLAETGGG